MEANGDRFDAMLGLDQSRRDDFTIKQNKVINIKIESCEFLSAAKYYITVQLDEFNEKKRTELSDELTNPLFIANNFSFKLPSGRVEVWQRVLFELYMISKERYTKKDSAKLIAQYILDLGQLSHLINSPESMGVKQSLSFIKNHQGEDYQIGRFNVTLSLENDYSKEPGQENSYFNGGVADPIEASNMVHQMPLEQENYLWRLRIDLRCCIDAPMNTATATKLPSCFAEFGWSNHSQSFPEPQNKLLSLVIPQERHPHWNQQLLYHSPPE